MDGKEAVDTFEKELPDLILMDINMPVMSGYDATKLIRKTANGKDVPIVALTAGTLNDEKIKSIESGMNDYISKPIVIETLELILEKYICFKKT
jgi:CheY-like chemotaxis protein